MTLEEEFHEEMLNIYKRAGEEVGYWARYFLRAVKRHGGLPYAHMMLRPQKKNEIHSGLQALIDAGRTDISVEYLVVNGKFNSLFSPLELQEAQLRISNIPGFAVRNNVPVNKVFPETLDPNPLYVEGAIKQVITNAYERDSKAREACLAKHGTKCLVCKIDFFKAYGEIGRGFIHVHHKKPLATIRREYKLNPIKDLVPVCPNCHAMLHTKNPPLSINELKELMKISHEK